MYSLSRLPDDNFFQNNSALPQSCYRQCALKIQNNFITKESILIPCIVTSTSLWASLSPLATSSIVYFYNFIILIILYKQSSTRCNLSDEPFPQHHSLEIHPSCCECKQCVLSYCKQYSMVRTQHSQFNHSLTERSLGCFQFGMTMNKAAMNIQVQAFLREQKFHLSGINGQEYNCWVTCWLHVSFFTSFNKLFSSVTALFYITISNV